MLQMLELWKFFRLQLKISFFNKIRQYNYYLRALSSVWQSASLTRKKSQVQILQRPQGFFRNLDKKPICTHKTPTFWRQTFFINYYEIMKYKKDLGGLFVILGFTWQVFDSIRFSYTPTQAIFVVIFVYLGVRLTYFVYFKNNK